MSVSKFGFGCGIAAVTATLAYDVVQILQVAGVLRFPVDEILIYGTSLCIVIPFVLEMAAFHHLTRRDRQFWSLSALAFTVMYAVFVTSNYVVQLATVIPAKIAGRGAELRLLDQYPHSLFWDYDAAGYIMMGVACLVAIPALEKTGVERWARRALLANALVTPLIAVVYFAPTFSTRLLFLGFPWAITAPAFMLALAFALRGRNPVISARRWKDAISQLDEFRPDPLYRRELEPRGQHTSRQ